MRDDRLKDDELLQCLKMVAPGTSLREGLENVLKAKTGGLIVLGDSQDVMKLVDGGFFINCDFSPALLYELAKMDGAIILSRDGKRILHANTQLIPDASIPSSETGIRHRTAERVSRQTGELVISISQRRHIITIYKGYFKYILRDLGIILTKANQALQTLTKYKTVLEKALNNLGALEFDDMVTVADVAYVIQKNEMVIRVIEEVEKYIYELGIEGRLVSMQLDELAAGIKDEELMIIMDYIPQEEIKNYKEKIRLLRNLSSDELLDLTSITKIMNIGSNINALDVPIFTRGYRILNKIPRLPMAIIENLVINFPKLQMIMLATIEELDNVEGIGEVRARTIKEGLKRIFEQVNTDRNI